MKLPEESVLNDEFYFSDDLDDSSPPSSPVRDGDFSEYMWMEHEDEFDSAVSNNFYDSYFFFFNLISVTSDIKDLIAMTKI